MILLQVVTDAQVDAAIKQAAAVYFKNLINKRYDPYDESKVSPLGDGDKAMLRSLIVPAVISCVIAVR